MNSAEHCGHCGYWNHKTKDCKFLGQNKCGICKRFGHNTEDCYSKKAKDLKHKRDKEGGKNRKNKKQKKEEINQGEEIDDGDEDEHIAFNLEESSEIPLDESEEGQAFNLNQIDLNSDCCG